MPFKINISDKGKTLKIETNSEALIGKKIGETFSGKDISPDLQNYELEITGTSDLAGFPGIKGHEGSQLRKVLLTRKDKGMNDARKGARLRKSIRGEEISEKTIQINTIVKKQGNKKFEELLAKKGEEESESEEKTEPKHEEKTEEKPKSEKPKEEPKQEVKEEKPKEAPEKTEEEPKPEEQAEKKEIKKQTPTESKEEQKE